MEPEKKTEKAPETREEDKGREGGRVKCRYWNAEI